jgi:hypothetical protein
MVRICLVKSIKTKFKRERLIVKITLIVGNSNKIYFMEKASSEVNYIIMNLLEPFRRGKKYKENCIGLRINAFIHIMELLILINSLKVKVFNF